MNVRNSDGGAPEYSAGDRVEFLRSPGKFGVIVSGPYDTPPWGDEDEPTYLVRGDNGMEGYRSPDVLRPA